MTLLGMVFDDDADDDTVTCMYQVGPHVLQIRQRPGEGSFKEEGYEDLNPEDSATVSAAAAAAATPEGGGTAAAALEGGGAAGGQAPGHPEAYVSNTPNVGFLVWSSSFVLADYLFRNPPPGRDSWQGVRVLELGAGTGVLGVALALSGAHVTMTDLPHITPLARQNADLNCSGLECPPAVEDYQWGQDATHLGEKFEVVVAADCVYEAKHFPDLLCALCDTCTPDSLIYNCYKKRRLREEVFEQAVESSGMRLRRVANEDLGDEHREGGYRLSVLQLPLPPAAEPPLT